MVKSIEPKVKDWFIRSLSDNSTKYNIEQESINSEIEAALKAAPSKSGGTGTNRPDFQMMISPSNMKHYPVMIEAKGTKGKLEKLNDTGTVNNTVKNGESNFSVISGFAVNGAVHYAQAIIDNCPSYPSAIAVGINGIEDDAGVHFECAIYYISKDNLCIPKLIGNDISLLYKANWDKLSNLISEASLSEAEKESVARNAENVIEGNLKELNQLMQDDLNISVGSRVELVTGMIMAGLGIKGEVAPLDIAELKGMMGDNSHDGIVILNRIKDFLTAKGLPEDKRNMIVNDLQRVFLNRGLWEPVNCESKLRKVYSFVHDNIIPFTDPEKSTYLDFTGKLFNVLTEWVDIPDGGKNDVVLTPRYVTDMMAKIAGVNKDSYVWDWTVGTAGFLVSSMKLMLADAENITDLSEKAKKQAVIRSTQLLGVEKRPDIYLLGVLNMILMGDGSTNILQQDSLTEFDGCYGQGDLKGQAFRANVALLNPPYSADGKGFIFLEKILDNMNHGRAAILIQENAGSGNGLPYTKRILEHNTLLASIHMSDIFKGKAGVQTAVYLFDVGTPHNANREVTFINMENDGYTRQNRKKASAATNLRDTDHAAERYAEVVDIILGNRKTTDFYKDGTDVFRDVITLNGNDWTLNQHKKYDTEPTEEDFRKTVADYLSFKVGQILRGEEVG